MCRDMWAKSYRVCTVVIHDGAANGYVSLLKSYVRGGRRGVTQGERGREEQRKEDGVELNQALAITVESHIDKAL